MADCITFVKTNHKIIATEFIESDDGFDKTSDYKMQAYEIIENDDGIIKLANYSSTTKSNHKLYCNEIMEDIDAELAEPLYVNEDIVIPQTIRG